MSGLRFGRLLVVGRDSKNSGRPKWICLCDCGKVISTVSHSLRGGRSTSCGCYRRERFEEVVTVHGSARQGKKTPTYNIWGKMIARCHNPLSRNFQLYGARGIQVCQAWRDSFSNFVLDMGEVPLGMTLERTDNNKGYSPENCRWATRAEQANNTRCNVLIKYNDQILLAADFAAEIGMLPSTLRASLKRGTRIFNGVRVETFKRGIES